MRLQPRIRRLIGNFFNKLFNKNCKKVPMRRLVHMPVSCVPYSFDFSFSMRAVTLFRYLLNDSFSMTSLILAVN